jgi:hypothetical protein
MTLFSALASVASARGMRKDRQDLVVRRNVGPGIRSRRIAKHVVHACAGSDDGSAFVRGELRIDVQVERRKIIIGAVVIH